MSIAKDPTGALMIHFGDGDLGLSGFLGDTDAGAPVGIIQVSQLAERHDPGSYLKPEETELSKPVCCLGFSEPKIVAWFVEVLTEFKTEMERMGSKEER